MNALRDARNDITNLFLDTCKKFNIRRVAIECEDFMIESSKRWMGNRQNCLFADEVYDDIFPRPAIWLVAGAIPQLQGGCGNSGQYQVRYGHGLEKGVYEYSSLSGEWFKRD